MTRFTSIALLCAAVVPVLLSPSASAQEYGRIEDTQASAPGYFFFARPGEPTVSVTAVGAVGAKGRYLLGVGSTVADLVALSGGVPTPSGASATLEAESMEPTVRLFRGGAVVSETLYRDLYGSSATPTRLLDGDVVEVVVPASTALVSTARGYFVHARPGQETLVVTAAGAFAAPGRYVLEAGADVSDLLALAGGVAEPERDARTEVTATVTLYRDGAVSFTAPLEDLYTRTTPPLMEGDAVDLNVVTRRRTPFTWRDGLSVVTTALAVLIAVDRLTD